MQGQDNGRETGDAGYPGEGRLLQTDEELALEQEADRLPWLEADDDYEAPGVDTGRIIAFALIGVLALGAALAALWWLFSDRPEAGRLAEGSTIAAPDEPYKTRPEQPGGREVEGTGDSSFRVAEGEVAEGRIGELQPAKPSIDREQAPASGAASDTADEAAATPVVGVQVGAYSNRAAAESGWNQLIGRFADLQGRRYRIVQGVVDGATVYRLQAVAADIADADTLCSNLKAAGGDCQVKR